jgi:hypothetical protein
LLKEKKMNYPDGPSIGQSYGSTHWLIKKHAAGLSHADSIIQPPFQANCFNWILGHILAGRNEALSYLGGPTLWLEEEIALYKTGSEPITEANQGLTLGRLLADLDETQELIVEKLEQISSEDLPEVVDTRFGERPVGQHIAGLHWHETYHTGQLELLRELANSD